MKKIKGMNEAAWVLGTLLCALGVTLCAKAGFGLSMIAAPSYIIYLKLSELAVPISHGACEYLWQLFLLVFTCAVIRRFRIRYLFSFATGMIFGFAIDFWSMLLGGEVISLGLRTLFLFLGLSVTALAVALYFRTSYPLQMAEFMVTKISERYGFCEDNVKQVVDVSFFVLSIVLAVALHRSLKGIGIGTVVATLVNAQMIRFFGILLDKYVDFSPSFPRLCAFFSDNKD